MYNLDFYHHLDESRRTLWGRGNSLAHVDTQSAALEASSQNYFPPPKMGIVRCVEDSNGEWVPERVRVGKSE